MTTAVILIILITFFYHIVQEVVVLAEKLQGCDEASTVCWLGQLNHHYSQNLRVFTILKEEYCDNHSNGENGSG